MSSKDKDVIVDFFATLILLVIKIGLVMLIIYATCRAFDLTFSWRYIIPVIGVAFINGAFPLKIKIQTDDD